MAAVGIRDEHLVIIETITGPFARYRGWTLRAMPPQTEIVDNITNYGFQRLTFDTSSGSGKNRVEFVILSSTFKLEKAKFVSIMARLDYGDDLDAVYVVARDVESKKSVSSVAAEIIEAHPGVRIYAYDFMVFVCDILDCIETRHRILPPAEAKARLEALHLRPTDLPSINHRTDAPLKWLDARPGQIVELTRKSETAGEALAYRYVI